ncbi:hypothetical protein Poly21_47210 [Allorhodopirellula heiligendammensis]|uniref:Uncharacterized protein n=1 Tax=Allorhodopirellula heiligendammensis TaxID=2714739 RepID=A0A5C6BF63_9BACT|nr:hypothetical protein Poly21_47210 [Allorhodopirellula heiligendammensis]
MIEPSTEQAKILNEASVGFSFSVRNGMFFPSSPHEVAVQPRILYSRESVPTSLNGVAQVLLLKNRVVPGCFP